MSGSELDADVMEDEGRRPDDWEWTLTNIGAVLSLAGLVLAVGVFGLWLISGIIWHVILIPGILMIVIGYAFIVKDHLDRRGREHRGRSDRTEEEE